jgi:protein-tyrosine-phosphatase/DNA-binding transcriptional ArsR family regulator
MAADLRDAPPDFVRLVAHPIRWRLLKELTVSDRAVRELTALLEEPQSLVSYHLRALRQEGLVTARTSTADARASYYAVDLGRCDDLLHESAAALHPGLGRSVAPAPARSSPRTRSRTPRVLFLCTGNGTRSQIAEALLTSMSDGAVEARSAGSRTKPVHPNAVAVLAARGIDISAARSKHLDRFTDERFDRVVTLCDRVREVCPEPPGWPDAVHWSIPDPGLEGDSDDETYPAFERTVAELEQRIRYLLATIDD